jgi:NADH dehydrogenase
MKVVIVGGNELLRRSISEACATSGLHPRPADSADDASDMLRDGEAAVVVTPYAPGGQRAGGADPETMIAQAREARLTRGVVVALGAPTREALRQIEQSVQGSAGEWMGLFAPHVYGIGEDPLTLLLVMMRSLPAVPLLSDTYAMAPLWHRDLSAAVAAALRASMPAPQRVATLSGPERVSYSELYERLAVLTDRRPVRLPVPDFLAAHGSRLASALNLSSLDASALTHAADESAHQRAADARELLALSLTGLDTGLKALIHELDELTPGSGVGTVQIKRFRAAITGARLDAAELMRAFRSRFAEMMPVPVGVEPAAPATELVEGAVLTIALPGRGHVQIRVEDVAPEYVVVGTLRGHALAGVVRFSASHVDGSLVFEVTTCDAAANPLDWLGLTIGGGLAQNANWRKVVRNAVALSGGRAGEVESHIRNLTPDEALAAESWVARFVAKGGLHPASPQG